MGYNPNHPHTVHDPQEVFRWSPVQIASEAHFSWSVTFLHWSKNGNFFSKAMLVQKPALRLYFLPFSQRNVLSFGGFFKVRMGERSVRIREVKGSNPSRSTNLPHRFYTMRRFLCSKNFGRPCRAPNPEVGCEPGGVINVLFENPSVSRFFLLILHGAAGKRIAFMPPSRKFLQKFPHHRRMTQPWAVPLGWSWHSGWSRFHSLFGRESP